MVILTSAMSTRSPRFHPSTGTIGVSRRKDQRLFDRMVNPRPWRVNAAGIAKLGRPASPAERENAPPGSALRLFRRVELLPRVLDVRQLVELDVRQVAVDHLGAADVDVLDDV